MRRKTQKQFDRLEFRTKQLFSYLSQVPDQMLLIKPASQQWSILEIVNHLYLSERLSYAYVCRKLQSPKQLRRRKYGAWMKEFLLKLFLRSPLKFKSPPQINMQGDQSVLPLKEVENAWELLRMELRAFLDANSGSQQNKLPFRHPLVGRMTLDQMLVFFHDHLMRHHRQIRKTLHRLGYQDR